MAPFGFLAGGPYPSPVPFSQAVGSLALAAPNLARWGSYGRTARGEPDSWLFVGNFASLGDTYVLAAFAPALLKEHGGESVRLVVHPPHVPVAELFAPAVVALPDPKVPTISQVNPFLAISRPFRPGVALPGFVYPQIYYRLRGVEVPRRAIDLVRCYFRLGAQSLPARPKPPSPERVALAREHLSSMGLVPGKTAILAPGTRTFSALDPRWWELIRDGLRSEGWSVATNVSPRDTPVPGTTPFPMALSDALAATEAAGWLIARRSGFCDVVSSSRCRLTVLYDARTLAGGAAHVSEFEWSGLRDLQLSDSAQEVEISGPPNAETVGQILRGSGSDGRHTF